MALGSARLSKLSAFNYCLSGLPALGLVAVTIEFGHGVSLFSKLCVVCGNIVPFVVVTAGVTSDCFLIRGC